MLVHRAYVNALIDLKYSPCAMRHASSTKHFSTRGLIASWTVSISLGNMFNKSLCFYLNLCVPKHELFVQVWWKWTSLNSDLEEIVGLFVLNICAVTLVKVSADCWGAKTLCCAIVCRMQCFCTSNDVESLSPISLFLYISFPIFLSVNISMYGLL